MSIHPYTFLPCTNVFKNRGTKHYEEDPQTVGGHIRKKRIESKLLQKQVAEQLKVSEDTLTYWENECTLPQIHYYPAIISFLGYYPFDHEVESLSGKLKQIRHCLGLNFKQCGAMLQVSVDAAKRWVRQAGGIPRHKATDRNDMAAIAKSPATTPLIGVFFTCILTSLKTSFF